MAEIVPPPYSACGRWQLYGQASAREVNARWAGRGPDGTRLTEARLNLNLSKDQVHGDSLNITVYSLLTNPFRPSLAESLELLFKADRDPDPGPFIDLFSISFLMFTIFGTLWGPLADELSTRIFSQPLSPPAQVDLAVFSVCAEDRGYLGARRRPAINTCINFAPARLIDGAASQACTLLDPIEPDLNLLNCDEQDKIVHDWLSQLCLDNGYEDFEQELTRISQALRNS